LLSKEPSETVQLAAVKQNYEAIRHIADPSESVKLAAAEQDIKALDCLKLLNMEHILRAIHAASEKCVNTPE